MEPTNHHLNIETEEFKAIMRGSQLFKHVNDGDDFSYFDLVTFWETVDGIETNRCFGPVEINFLVYVGDKGDSISLPSKNLVFYWKPLI